MPSLTMAFTMVFRGLLLVLATILEAVEDVYLFWESHYDRQRDFEKLDDFITLSLSYAFKMMCLSLFAACLGLWTWYSPQPKQSSRQDMEAEIDHALDQINAMKDENRELRALLDKTLEDRQSTQDDYGRLATQNTVLENKLARLESKPDLEDKHSDLETRLEEAQAQRRRLVVSLERSRRLRREDDSERKALSDQASKAKGELLEVRASIAKLEGETESKEALYKERLTRLENDRDQANQNQQAEKASAAQRIGELEQSLREAKDATAKNPEAAELENTRNQLAEIEHLRSEIAATKAQQSTLSEKLRTKDAELQRLSAQHHTERESLRQNIAALQSSLEARDNTMDVDAVPDNNAMEVDVVTDHACDHSQCVNQANIREQRIQDLETSLMRQDLKVDGLQSKAKKLELKIEGLKAELEDEKAAKAQLQRSVGANALNADSCEIRSLQIDVGNLKDKLQDRDWVIDSMKQANQRASRRSNDTIKTLQDQLRAKQKELDKERAGRQKALEAERTATRDRFAANNPLQAENARLKDALNQMTAERDRCRVSIETYRNQCLAAKTAARETEEAQRAAQRAAQMAAEESEAAQRAVEEQRDGLVQAVGQLQGKMAGMVEVERMTGTEDGSASKKRQNEGDEDPRPAKILRDE